MCDFFPKHPPLRMRLQPWALFTHPSLKAQQHCQAWSPPADWGGVEAAPVWRGRGSGLGSREGDIMDKGTEAGNPHWRA